MKIGTILACREQSTAEFAERLAATFVPLAASSKVVIRHEAQWRVPILMDYCRSKGRRAITENPAYASLDSYIRSLDRFSDPPLERRIGTFDPENDLTLSNLIEGQWFDLDHLEPPLTSRDEFVKLYAESIPSHAPATCIPLGPNIHRVTVHQSNEIPTNTSSPPSLGPRTATESSTALQTKGTAYLSRTLSDPTSHTKRPHDLIVIGSLVDNPHNLGGLSRVAEIFGASALTLQNQNVASNRDFTSVSVSSHLHFPIIQLSAPNIPAFLAERKREGYTVVGIEQTDRSLMLGSEACALPKKVVLVVGSEKEGIPAAVLTACDVLVEIEQVGVTRSLNVQTAVAIVLFEYVRQRERHG
jgi:tRNA guanosine-2'-O-methyltransferase